MGRGWEATDSRGISSKAVAFGGPGNKHRFNGYELQTNEFNDGSSLEWYDYKHRFYDHQLGRFFVTDRLASKYPFWTPYQFAGNVVPNARDLDGLEPEYVIDSKHPIDYVNHPENVRTGLNIYKNLGILMASAFDVGLGFSLFVSDRTGIPTPVSPAPTSVVTSSTSEITVATEVSATENAASEGVDLTIKAKPTWNPEQIAQAESKAEQLTNAETIVTKQPVARDPNLRTKFVKSGAQVTSNQDVDHVVDLQLGGTNEGQLQALDKSVNRSFGAQIQHQTKNLPDNTRVNRIILQLPAKE